MHSVPILPLLVAAVAAWLFGAAYYGVLGRKWLEAQGKTMDVDGQPAKVVLDGKSGAPKDSANTSKAQREAEQQRLVDVPLEELARTLAVLEQEAEPHKTQKSVAENALNKIAQRKKLVIAELERRGQAVLDRDLGKGEFDYK